LRAIPTGWTDTGPPEPFVELSEGRAYFRTEDLLALAALLKGLEREDGAGGDVK
jgi:hypothetical protein